MTAHALDLSRHQVRALVDENETLRESVRLLERMLAPPAILPRAWRLTASQERLLRAVRKVGPDVLHHERAMVALYGTAEDWPEPKILDVMICKIRQKLMEAQAQIRIETIWGRGWRMTAESCARFDAAVAADRAAYGEAPSISPRLAQKAA